MTTPSPLLYGIWIHGQGWLSTPKGIVSFDRIEVAKDTAKRTGGEVRYIDEALRDLEQNILSLEAQPARKWYQKLWSK